MSRDTNWLRESGWGLLVHYLADLAGARALPQVSVDGWNARVDAFDVQGLARQLEALGAKYFFLTVGQNSGFYCAPNATYDRLVGIRPSKCSRRDLISDLADALLPRGIRMCVYATTGAPENEAAAVEKLHYRKVDEQYQEAQRNAEFQVLWEEVLRDWSLRWGNKVSAWWMDGCYVPDGMYRNAEAPNFGSLTAAIRAGNPQALIAFNPGVKTRPTRLTEHEDYTAGEIDFYLPLCGRWPDGRPVNEGEAVGGAVFHLLGFLGDFWGSGSPRFGDGLVTDYTRHVIEHGGAMTWDVPVTYEGRIEEAFVGQLAKLKGLRGRRVASLG